MKKTIIKAIAIGFVSIIIQSACNSPSKIVENAQISKQKAIEISDRINNLSCPESWYKGGDFQMTCE